MMVSVVIITYAQDNYIRAALNGALMQKCSFPVEIIVSNDASPDCTDEVISDIIENNKTEIRIDYTHHKTNLGMMGNFIWALNQAKGKYIAICEGDDYWTDLNKLQVQVDFLETNTDYSMCFHPVEITMATKTDYYEYPLPPSDTLSLKNIIDYHYIPTCSLVFRNNLFPQGLPKWMQNSISGDIPLEILLAEKGKVKYFPKIMACYRRNEGGISQSPVQLAKMRIGYINMYSKLASEISFPYSFFLYKKVIRIQLSIIKNVIWRFIGF